MEFVLLSIVLSVFVSFRFSFQIPQFTHPNETTSIQALQGEITSLEQNPWGGGGGGGGGGVPPNNRLMGVCRWMGSHFHDWVDYNQ